MAGDAQRFGIEKNRAATRGIQPVGGSFFPARASGKRADGVEIAFQIGEGVFACGVVQAFFAGGSGGADGEDASFDGLAAVQAIVMGDFEKADVALAVIEIPFERGGHETMPVERRTPASSESGLARRAG